MWFGFFMLLICGCVLHSQEKGVYIITTGDAKVIDYSVDSVKVHTKIDVSKSKKIHKEKIKLKENHKANVKYSRKNQSETPKTQNTYKTSENDLVFFASIGKNISAVFSPSHPSASKKNLREYTDDFIVLFKEYHIKRNTYYYLFSKDTGKLYQFFNKPPPYIS
ncbi:Uncharacterised protein [Chryseobacterium taihuense]|uniref:Uncharacterized protein n=1 Tax=Chryseobacterium taihuense TaxID=1141221 RepID=A0A4U8WFK1_9FLAO|nr:Uncharacterised protein [Chryseobacterium taihuense]